MVLFEIYIIIIITDFILACQQCFKVKEHREVHQTEDCKTLLGSVPVDAPEISCS